MKTNKIYFDASNYKQVKDILRDYIYKLKEKDFVEFKMLPERILRVKFGATK